MYDRRIDPPSSPEAERWGMGKEMRELALRNIIGFLPNQPAASISFILLSWPGGICFELFLFFRRLGCFKGASLSRSMDNWLTIRQMYKVQLNYFNYVHFENLKVNIEYILKKRIIMKTYYNDFEILRSSSLIQNYLNYSRQTKSR